MASQPVALITGASSGIGQATAQLLAAHGFAVFGTSRTPDRPARGYALLPLDVRSEAAATAVVQSVLARAGQIDLLVNNAGYAQSGAIEENSIAEVQAQLDINLLGVLRLLKAVLPVMRRQGRGRVINVSSVQGRIAPPYLGVYATSKFALEGLTEALRDEVQPFGIYVSLIEPSFVKSNFVRQVPADPIADYTSGRQGALHFVSAGVARGVEPEAVAQVILRAATTPRPHLRYPVGRRAYLLMLLSRLLPEPAVERVRRRVFRPQAQPY